MWEGKRKGCKVVLMDTGFFEAGSDGKVLSWLWWWSYNSMAILKIIKFTLYLNKAFVNKKIHENQNHRKVSWGLSFLIDLRELTFCTSVWKGYEFSIFPLNQSVNICANFLWANNTIEWHSDLQKKYCLKTRCLPFRSFLSDWDKPYAHEMKIIKAVSHWSSIIDSCPFATPL